MRTISQIIETCGGVAAIADASGSELSHWAVRKWPANGIPEKNWALIRSLIEIEPGELHAANEMARAERAGAAA
jgi:hypothetical protein